MFAAFKLVDEFSIQSNADYAILCNNVATAAALSVDAAANTDTALLLRLLIMMMITMVCPNYFLSNNITVCVQHLTICFPKYCRMCSGHTVQYDSYHISMFSCPNISIRFTGCHYKKPTRTVEVSFKVCIFIFLTVQ